MFRAPRQRREFLGAKLKTDTHGDLEMPPTHRLGRTIPPRAATRTRTPTRRTPERVDLDGFLLLQRLLLQRQKVH
jgi:hypothetical protein